MRKLLAVLLAALILCVLVACDNGGAVSSDPASVGSEPTTTTTTSTTTSMTSTTSTTESATATEVETTTTPVPSEAPETTTMGSRTRTTTTTTAGTTTTTISPLDYTTENEKPITYDTSILYNEMHSESDPEAEAMKQTVLNAKDEVGPSATGTTYYVSYKGNDANDGKSKATAWRTAQRVCQEAKKFKSGDVVLFERGGVYRGTLQVVSGMKVGAYGSGPKPQIYAGPCNVADPKYWKETKYENVWRLDIPEMSDVGNIVFEHGEICASTTRMFKEFLITESKYKAQDYYYYHNVGKGYIYMYYSKGNPGEDFESIELCPKDSIVTCVGNEYSNTNIAQDIVVDNLCLKYSGAFGVVFSAAKNITVTNCEIGYIGGSLQGAAARYGNGIEFNSHVDGAVIRNNWIYQCYDAGYTNQGWGAKQTNLLIRANLIEYCPYNIELFCDKNVERGTGCISDTVIEKNILRFAGYGFGTKNRFGSGDDNISNITGVSGWFDAKGFIIRDNIMDTSYRNMVRFAYCDGAKGPMFENNTWIQWNDTKSCVADMRDTDILEQTTANMRQPSTDQATMEASVAKMESNPKYVKFYSK